MAGPRDPTRRNRNIGTVKQGHGSNNVHRIPRRFKESVLDWRRGDHPYNVVTRVVWGRKMPILVEKTRNDSVHACTCDDIARMLNLMPKRHINRYHGICGIEGIVLRQPTRKEELLNSVWARLGYAVQVGPITGPVIFIVASKFPLELEWETGLSPEALKELERLRHAADHSHSTKRSHRLRFGLEGIRRVQLYHSLPHEVGHWADMYENVELPGLEDYEEWDRRWNRYFQRPSAERETFAHAYADEVRTRLRDTGDIPFERAWDRDAAREEGLDPNDFEEHTDERSVPQD